MELNTREYVKKILEDMISCILDDKPDVYVGIRHYNSLTISKEEIDDIAENNKKIDIFYFHYDTSDFGDAYEPFLKIIRKLINKNDVDIDAFLEVCNVYSLHRGALSSYFKGEPVFREEDYIYNEIEFESRYMCKAIVNMLDYFSKQKKIIIVLNKLHRASKSSIKILLEIMKSNSNRVGFLYSYNEFAVFPEYVQNTWNDFETYMQEKNSIKDWGFNTILGIESKSRPFNFYAGRMMDYIDKLEEMYNLVDLEQANYYASILHRKLLLEEINVSPSNMLQFYELYAKIAIYLGDTSSAIIACDAYEKQMQMYPSAIKKYKYYYLLALAQLYSGQIKQAQEYAYRCKMATNEMGTEYTRFRAELLEHMTLFSGWNNIWLCELNYDVDDKLLKDARKYNFLNHLAHIYVYARNTDSSLYSEVGGIEERLSDFNKGIKIAEEIGNTFLVMAAYRKNLMTASSNGYFSVAKYFITEKLQPLVMEAQNTFEQGNIFNDLGYNSCAVEKYDIANEYFKKALNIFTELKREEYIGETLYNMAINGIMAHDYKLASECLEIVISIINVFHWESLRVAHVSKIFGLMSYCQYRLGDIYESLLNLNFAEQFLKHIVNDELNNTYMYWDDDLFLYHICKGLHAFNEKDYRKAEKEYKKAYRYGGPGKGGATFYYSIYAREMYELYKVLGRNDEAEHIINVAKDFYDKKSLGRRVKDLEQIYTNGEIYDTVKLIDMDKAVKMNLWELLEKTKSEFQFNLYQDKVKYLSTWLKLQSEDYTDTEHLINNSILSLMNEFSLDKLVMVKMKDKKTPQVVFNNIGPKMNNERVGMLCEYLKTHHSVFAASKLNKNFFEYEGIANVFDETHLCALMGVPLYNNEKLEAFIFGYIVMSDNWGGAANKIVISNQEVNLFEFLFRQLMESVARFEYRKEIREQNKELSRLNLELSNVAVRDQLTGLLNRQGYTSYVKEMIQQSEDDNTPIRLTVMYFDLDKFKLCNDTFGHAGGDAVLREFAGLLQEACDFEGKVIRYGGDEFLLILMNTEREKLEKIVERVYQEINNTNGFSDAISAELDEDIIIEESKRVSTSIGIASVEDILSEGVVKDTVANADAALYYIKEHGKSRACFYEDINN